MDDAGDGTGFDILRCVQTGKFRSKALAGLICLVACAMACAAGAVRDPKQAPGSSGQGTTGTAPSPAQAASLARPVLNMVVLDPAHGGTDPGARGAQGIRESDLLLDLTLQVRRALEAQGFQVIQTRSGNENPSFDDRSTLANAQPGAVFLTLHISSTGLPGTARVYAEPDLPARATAGGVLSWEVAQAPYVTLSRKFGDAVQGELAQRFKGSPRNVQTASVRQLRTTAAPAIAVEISSVSVQDRSELDKMMPGVAEAIARGVATFRPAYVVPGTGGAQP